MTLEFYVATLAASLVTGYFYGSMEFDMETRYAILFSTTFGLCAFLLSYGIVLALSAIAMNLLRAFT